MSLLMNDSRLEELERYPFGTEPLGLNEPKKDARGAPVVSGRPAVLPGLAAAGARSVDRAMRDGQAGLPW